MLFSRTGITRIIHHLLILTIVLSYIRTIVPSCYLSFTSPNPPFNGTSSPQGEEFATMELLSDLRRTFVPSCNRTILLSYHGAIVPFSAKSSTQVGGEIAGFLFTIILTGI
ncbi:MAG: hypothetical protein K9I68_09890 [Bacteroidales bacterium]|nr:hypothetical protein [Bacteroidales bacterium]MCF8339003.1 hypothetical protein [Bacteroidales bacterium]